MQYVNTHDLNSEAWTLIAENKKNVAIQFDKQGSIRVHVGTEEPEELSAPGILVASSTAGVPMTFGMGALPQDAKVWAKATGEADTTEITVLAY